jgi:hypothetical protein
MLQQILKLAAAPSLGVDSVIIVDSDVVLVRQMEAELFFRGRTVRLYERPAAITADMNRHVSWTRAAHRLLGLPEPDAHVFPDYVAGIISWDPNLVRSCLERIQEVTGKTWATAIAAQLHFSEFILYGTYVRHFGDMQELAYAEATSLCHSYWTPTPMSGPLVTRFINSFGPPDVAVHIQSNSSTSEAVRNQVLTTLRNPAHR